MKFSTLAIHGYENQPIANLFIQQEQFTDSLVVVFPGYGYHADLPVLYYPRLMALEHGADVLRLDTAYNRNSAYTRLDDAGQLAWIDADAGAALDVVLKHRSYSRLLLIGKSLGTMVMGGLLQRIQQFPASAWLWLTPVLNDPRLVEQVIHHQPTSLFVIGTADQYYNSDVLEKLTSATHSQPVVIPGANHSLEVPGRVQQSLQALKDVMAAVGAFIETWGQQT